MRQSQFSFSSPSQFTSAKRQFMPKIEVKELLLIQCGWGRGGFQIPKVVEITSTSNLDGE
jgi:hypothetical protein